MTYCALERPIHRATAKSTLKSDVNIGLASRVSPTWSSTPVTEKTTAMRKRGSLRNNPFQLACIAHNESGR